MPYLPHAIQHADVGNATDSSTLLSTARVTATTTTTPSASSSPSSLPSSAAAAAYDCSPGCRLELLANGVCDAACNTPACAFDGGDCACVDPLFGPGICACRPATPAATMARAVYPRRWARISTSPFSLQRYGPNYTESNFAFAAERGVAVNRFVSRRNRYAPEPPCPAVPALRPSLPTLNPKSNTPSCTTERASAPPLTSTISFQPSSPISLCQPPSPLPSSPWQFADWHGAAAGSVGCEAVQRHWKLECDLLGSHDACLILFAVSAATSCSSYPPFPTSSPLPCATSSPTTCATSSPLPAPPPPHQLHHLFPHPTKCASSFPPPLPRLLHLAGWCSNGTSREPFGVNPHFLPTSAIYDSAASANMDPARQQHLRRWPTVAAVDGSVLSYFCLVWNWVDMLSLALQLAAVVIWVVLWRYVDAFDMQPRYDIYYTLLEMPRYWAVPNPPTGFIGATQAFAELRNIINLRAVYFALQGINVFFMMIRLLKVMDFQPYLGVITRSLSLATPSLLHFFLLSFAVFFCFSMYGYLVFGGALEMFSTVLESMFSCFLLLLNDNSSAFFFQRLESWDLIAAMLFFFMFIVFMVFILLNFLIAIIVDAFMSVKDSNIVATSITSDLGHIIKYKWNCWRGRYLRYPVILDRLVELGAKDTRVEEVRSGHQEHPCWQG
ncbi:unnamed protein product [Closterium sp. NIES-64]|nr:unnamed protein product [Closterium sp. NIES-64]